MSYVPKQILLADSGSSKTDWLLHIEGKSQTIRTSGLNPYLMSSKEICGVLERELVPYITGFTPLRVCFWGAGCCGQGISVMSEALGRYFPNAMVTVESDLLGAARALYGCNPGVACILGTGANSGVFDGQQIIAHIPPLGYLLGDEGSGSSLGKRFLNQLLKKALPDSLCREFYKKSGFTAEQILFDVYHTRQPNRFLAQFAPFLYEHRHEECVHKLLVEEFQLFFEKNVCPYQRADINIGFVGSIAFYFSEELSYSAHVCGLQIGRILQNPLEAFIHEIPDWLLNN